MAVFQMKRYRSALLRSRFVLVLHAHDRGSHQTATRVGRAATGKAYAHRVRPAPNMQEKSVGHHSRHIEVGLLRIKNHWCRRSRCEIWKLGVPLHRNVANGGLKYGV